LNKHSKGNDEKSNAFMIAWASQWRWESGAGWRREEHLRASNRNYKGSIIRSRVKVDLDGTKPLDLGRYRDRNMPSPYW